MTGIMVPSYTYFLSSDELCRAEAPSIFTLCGSLRESVVSRYSPRQSNRRDETDMRCRKKVLSQFPPHFIHSRRNRRSSSAPTDRGLSESLSRMIRSTIIVAPAPRGIARAHVSGDRPCRVLGLFESLKDAGFFGGWHHREREREAPSGRLSRRVRRASKYRSYQKIA